MLYTEDPATRPVADARPTAMSDRPDVTPVPDALLFLTASCPFCPTVLEGLTALLKTGRIGRLEVINLERYPQSARELGVRSVPWVRIGAFELEGLRSPAELEVWASRAGTQDGMAEYLKELLAGGELPKAVRMVSGNRDHFRALLRLLSNPETDLHVRLGIGALMESLQGSPALQQMIEALGEISLHPEPHIRSDACHYLSLTEHPAAQPYIEARLNDDQAQVREVAAESLKDLRAAVAAQ